jgi:hypothetical protein
VRASSSHLMFSLLCTRRLFCYFAPMICLVPPFGRVTWPPETELADVLFIPPREPKSKSVVTSFIVLVVFVWLLSLFISKLLS